LNADFSSARPDSVDSKNAHMGVKKGYPLKSGYFTAIGWSSVIKVADKHRHATFITSTGNELLRSVNTDDFE